MNKRISGGAERSAWTRNEKWTWTRGKKHIRFGKRVWMLALATFMAVAVIVPSTVLAETSMGGGRI